MVSNEKNVFGKFVFGYDKLSEKWIIDQWMNDHLFYCKVIGLSKDKDLHNTLRN